MKKQIILATLCVYLGTATMLPAFSNYSSQTLSKSNPFAIIPGTATTTMRLYANGGEFDDGTTEKIYEPDTTDALTLYSNGGEFTDGSTMKTYKKDALTLDASGGVLENGTSTTHYIVEKNTKEIETSSDKTTETSDENIESEGLQ